MKRLVTTLVGLTCCVGATYANSPRVGLDTAPAPALLGSATAGRADLGMAQVAGRSAFPEQNKTQDGLEELSRMAYRISYIGSLILTADHVVRSVDSVLDSMELTRQDGTQLRVNMRPNSDGFEVSLKLSRPIEF
jgi:hypothetical protein